MDTTAQNYQLKFLFPFTTLAIRCNEDMVLAVDYLPAGEKPLSPGNLLAAECARQLAAYLKNPRRHRFDLPLLPAKTGHQRRVRAVVETVPGGGTMTYGEVAARLGNSSPRAVGGACRANELPLLVPCHRIVAAGHLGGFMGSRGENCIATKKQLLRLEGLL